MAYHVAYPALSLRPKDRVCGCDIEPKTYRKGLVSQLCEEYPDHTDDLNRASLWKAIDLKIADACDDSPQKIFDWIRKKDGSAEIPRSYHLVKSFPSGPHDEAQDQVDIVVVTPDVLESIQGDMSGELRYMKERQYISRAIKQGPSPSDSVESAAAVKKAVLDPGGPRYGRPIHRFGPPTALFSEPLALLQQNLGHLESFTPDPEILDHAFNLIEISTGFFADEKTREDSLKTVLGSLLVGQNKWQQSIAEEGTKKSIKPDGVWLEGPFVYLIFELKNEPGLGGDPFLQGLTVYGKITAHDKYASYLERSNLPVILLSIAGNHLSVSTAIFTNAVYANELLSITLQLGPHGSDNVVYVARVFMAINDSTEQLSDLYRSLLDPSPSLRQTKALWPDPTVDPTESPKQIPKLEYVSKVDRANGTELAVINEENERHAMYLARMQIGTSTQDVFVKFATKYNEDAHRLLAERNPPLAPALHFCARVIGGMYMVVMEYVPTSMGQSIFCTPIANLSSEVIQRDVAGALDLLHKKDFVFGDLREANLLYLPEDGGCVLFVDFDGVGRHGVDRYSATLNPETRLGVKRWQIMKKEDDNENLKRLVDRLSRRMSRNAPS